MEILNAGPSTEYFYSLVDERAHSAAIVIHLRWLNHSSELARGERLESAAPLDLLILHRAAVEAFACWEPGAPLQELAPPGGHVIHWEQARRRLGSIVDPEALALAIRFANRTIALSTEAECPQDLDYYVDLFLRGIPDPQAIEAVASGAISRHSRLLANFKSDLSHLDYW